MWAYESDIESPVPESEYSNPEYSNPEYFNPEYSNPEYSNPEYSNPESEDSHPGYECSASFMKASNIGANSPMPQSSQYPIYDSIAFPTMNPFNLQGPFAWNWDDDELKYAPLVSRPQGESSNSPKMAKRSTSSSATFRPQIPSPSSPDWEIAYNNPYASRKQQESRHATEKATSNDRATSSSSCKPKPKPYCCMFPDCAAAFARPYDLGRHQQSRHVNSKRFDCPVESCRRFGVPMASNGRGGFTRLDHFRDHVKNLHGKAVIKDKNSAGGQYWVQIRDGELWMRDETGSILVKDHNGRIQVKDAMTGRWHTRDR